MARYHINPKTGEPGLCRAQHSCPFGGREHHYSSQAEARQAYEVAQTSSFRLEPELFSVEDSWGDVSELAAGELTADARWIFNNGQCLALASALANELKSNTLLCVSRTEESDELAWDEENNEPLLNEAGEEYSETYEHPIHVYAMSADGLVAWDVDGPLELTKLKAHADSQGENVHIASTDEITAAFGGYLSEQNHSFASSFASTVLEQTSREVKGL